MSYWFDKQKGFPASWPLYHLRGRIARLGWFAYALMWNDWRHLWRFSWYSNYRYKTRKGSK